MYEFVFFFFKQKTAYEMRISDWSSDVCSSDLVLAAARAGLFEQRHACLDQRRQQRRQGGRTVSLVGVDADPRIRAARTYRTYARGIELRITGELQLQRARLGEGGGAFGHHGRIVRADRERGQQGAHAVESGELPHRHAGALRLEFPQRAVERVRSEEHTSELQSLMRISYAVFCLKKKI